jgi:hypothetical protein
MANQDEYVKALDLLGVVVLMVIAAAMRILTT